MKKVLIFAAAGAAIGLGVALVESVRPVHFEDDEPQDGAPRVSGLNALVTKLTPFILAVATQLRAAEDEHLGNEHDQAPDDATQQPSGEAPNPADNPNV